MTTELLVTEAKVPQKPLRRALKALFDAGVLEQVHRAWRHRLTVLTYHRIGEPEAVGRNGLDDNVSATPAMFAAQMDYLRERFSVVTFSEVSSWLRGAASLPPFPALITFDDGYRDNHDVALPILRQRGLPAVLFVATDCIGSRRPFYWDLAAYCFQRVPQGEADLPLLGPTVWQDEPERRATLRRWLSAAKGMPDARKREAVEKLVDALRVNVEDDVFDGLYMDWTGVRKLTEEGFEIGAHTCSHVILSRVPPDQVRHEIVRGKQLLEREVDRPVTAFAYPNGLAGDFDASHEALLRECGFEASFSLLDGPAGLRETRRRPMAIRRVCITHRDDLPRFAAKVTGLSRLSRRG